MKKRKYSKKHKDMFWYKSRLYCTNKNKKSAIEKLVDDIYPILELKHPESNKVLKKRALNVIISNAYEAYLCNKFAAVPFGRDYYTNLSNSNPKHNTYAYTVGGANALLKINYLIKKKGYFYKEHPEKNRVTGIKATQELLDAINRFTEPLGVVQNYYDTGECYTYTFSSDELKILDAYDVVELRDDSNAKKLIDYRPNRISISSKKFLRSYNLFIDGFNVKVNIKKINPSKYPVLKYYPDNTTISNQQLEYTTNITPLIGFCESNFISYKKLRCIIKRVFNNGDFEQGGRFYDAEYQFLNEEERSWITINDEPVVEIDYKTFHPRILYHKEGIDIKGDLYLMANPEEELRPAIKKMMNIMINTKSDYQARNAFEKDLLEDEKGGEIQTAMIIHRVDGWDLIRMIHKAHSPIETYFGSEIGIRVQYEDSELAKNILTHFRERRIACLCVHDSFLVQEKYKDELYEVMMNEYEKRFKFKPELEVNERKEEK